MKLILYTRDTRLRKVSVWSYLLYCWTLLNNKSVSGGKTRGFWGHAPPGKFESKSSEMAKNASKSANSTVSLNCYVHKELQTGPNVLMNRIRIGKRSIRETIRD